MRLNGAKTLLTLNGCKLILAGDNALMNSSDERDNAQPTVSVSGSVTITGPGSLYSGASLGNSAIMLSSGASLELTSGTLSVFKDGLLSIAGGALYANEASVTISGGVFNGYTNSDNVSVISANKLAITGGTVRVQAIKSPAAIEGETVSISGGTLYCYGHTGNSSSFTKAYNGQEAITGLSGSASCTFEQVLPFEDVIVTDEHFEAVRRAYNAGYFTGVSATEFAPDAGMTRAMFVTVLYRIAGEPNVNLVFGTQNSEFTDVPAGAWYSAAVAWAVENGITAGTSDTTFSPNAIVTAEQLALFLYRYMGMTGETVAPSNGDYGAGSSAWARAAASWAVENGVLPAGINFKADADRALLALAVSNLNK